MHRAFLGMSGHNERRRCPWQTTAAAGGLGMSRRLSGESGQTCLQQGRPGDAGLKHLDIAFVQPAAASLSSSLSALTCLTFLGLDRLLSLKQQGGCSRGAMSSLLLHLRHLNLQVMSACARHAKRASHQDWPAAWTCGQQPASICACLKCTCDEASSRILKSTLLTWMLSSRQIDRFD